MSEIKVSVTVAQHEGRIVPFMNPAHTPRENRLYLYGLRGIVWSVKWLKTPAKRLSNA